VPLPRVSSPFNARRGTRADGSIILHNGTDWPAPAGTPLHSMSDGTVTFRLVPPGNSGNAIGVKTPDGRTLWSFSHMQDVDVRVGERVTAGQVVGTVGFTGHVEPPGPGGAHVHVRVERDGKLIDPARAVRPSLIKRLLLAGGAAAAFYAFKVRAAGDGAAPGRGASLDPMGLKMQLVGGRVIRAGGAIDDELDALDFLVDTLEDERDRISRERLALLGSRGVLFDPLEMQTRADSLLALLEAIDRHIGVVLPRLESQARAGDLDAAKRAVTSTARIIEGVGGVNPLGDFVDDTTKLVKDLGSDSKKAAVGIGVAALVAGILYLVLLLGGRQQTVLIQRRM
jgi:hypothetical protein